MNAKALSHVFVAARVLIVVLLAEVPAMCQESRPTPSRVWVLAGQSNMEGNGYLEQQAADPNVRILRSSESGVSWEEGKEPSHRSIDPGAVPGWANGPARAGAFFGRKGTSPGVAFASARAARTRSIVGLIPCAVGGTSLSLWDPAKRSDPKSLYGNMLTLIKASGVKPEGLLWYQGESDAASKLEMGQTYARRFADFVAAVRRDLENPELPIIVTQLCRYVTSKQVPGWLLVQESQRLLPLEIPRTEFVATIDLSLDDPIHLSTASERRLGIRYAKAVASLLGETDATTSGPRPLKIIAEGPRRDRIVVTYRGVNGRLNPAERVQGFTLVDSADKELPIIFDACVDSKSPDRVVLRLASTIPEGAKLGYGLGLNPICNLVDDEDMAAPVFAPIVVN